MSGREWPMWQRIAVRVALLPVIFVVVSAFSHFVLYGPFAEGFGDVCDRSTPECNQDAVDQAIERLGLNDPWVQQYGRWLGDAVRGDFGRSYVTNRPVLPEIGDAILPTAEILVIALAVAVVAAFGLSVLHKSRSVAMSESALAIAALLVAVPVIMSLVLLLLMPLQWWDYLPPIIGFVSLREDMWANLRIVAPPAVTLGLTASPIVSIATRFEPAAFRTWRLGTSLLFTPAIALAFVAVAERVFFIPGAGTMLYEAVTTVDIPLVQALSSLILTFLLGASMLARLVDPGTAGDTAVVRALSVRGTARDPLVAAGILFCAGFVIAAIIGPEFSTDWRSPSPDRFDGPSLDHLLGTNWLGQDMLGQVLSAVRNSLVFVFAVLGLGYIPALVVVTLSSIRWPGLQRFFGAVTAYSFVVPTFVLLALFAVAQRFDVGSGPLLIAVCIFVAAIGAGTGAQLAFDFPDWSVIKRRGINVVEGLCWSAAFALLFKATMDFFGIVRPSPYRKALGELIADGFRYYPAHHSLHLILAPGITLTLIVFGFLLIALRLAAWRWEAERAPSSARSRTPP